MRDYGYATKAARAIRDFAFQTWTRRSHATAAPHKRAVPWCYVAPVARPVGAWQHSFPKGRMSPDPVLPHLIKGIIVDGIKG